MKIYLSMSACTSSFRFITTSANLKVASWCLRGVT